MNQTQSHTLEETIGREHANIAGLVVAQNGETRYETYRNGYAAADALHVFSVTKSVFSALIGIAVRQGRIKSVHDRVLSYFPDYALPAGETTAQSVTIEHLLTMTAPYKYDAEPYELFFGSPDPVKAALDFLGGDKPIGKFNYSAIGGTHILSAILTKATGVPVLDYAKTYLFGPLDIDVPQNIVLRSREEHMRIMGDRRTRGWAVDPQGRSTASWGLFLTPRDMAKIGQLYLNRGVWYGERIVPESWVGQSTAVQSRWGNLGYGYLWWVIDEGKRCFAAMGDGGNVVYVNGNRNLVVAIAATFAPKVKDRIALIKEHIEPYFS